MVRRANLEATCREVVCHGVLYNLSGEKREVGDGIIGHSMLKPSLASLVRLKHGYSAYAKAELQ